MGCCVKTSKLTKRYGNTLAVDEVSFEVESGEVLGLLGPNGAGKSTTLYMLAGLVPPTAGTVSIFGKDLRRDFLDIAARIGVVVERPAFYDYMPARDNLLLGARLAGRDVTVDRVLDQVGLLEVGARRVGTLSLGMKQRLALAQALLLDPELLILDEPANGLDPEAGQEAFHLLRRLADEAKVTVVISSHMLHEVEALCDRVAVLDQGRLVACDRTEALLSYDQRHVEVLIDAPESAAKRLREQGWVESVEVRSGRMDVVLQEPNAPQLAAFLVSAGYRVAGMIPRRRTLRDYYLKARNA
jgi:ABC-2 type transport system ATP-binding protein